LSNWHRMLGNRRIPGSINRVLGHSSVPGSLIGGDWILYSVNKRSLVNTDWILYGVNERSLEA